MTVCQTCHVGEKNDALYDINKEMIFASGQLQKRIHFFKLLMSFFHLYLPFFFAFFFSRPPIYVERQNQCTCELLSKLNWKLLVQSIRLRTIHWWLEDDSSLEQQLEHNGTCCCLNPWNDDRGNMTFEMAISVFHHNDYNLLTNQRKEFHFTIFLRPQNSFRLQNSNVLIIS